MGLFGYVYLLVPMMKNACRMAVASNIQKYTFKMAPGPCKQYFVMFSEDLKLSSRSDIYPTWGMAWAGLSGSELGADLSAWLAKIMARLSGSTALSQAVYITIGISRALALEWKQWLGGCSSPLLSRTAYTTSGLSTYSAWENWILCQYISSNSDNVLEFIPMYI